MPIQVQGDNGTNLGVGGLSFKAAHVHPKPLEYGSFGHYRTAVKLTLATTQAANARLFELRNSGGNLIIPTLIDVTVLPVGGVASPYLLDVSLFKCTAFTAVDTTNVLTPAVSVLRNGMAAAPGNVQVRHANGHQAGMTGGTMTKDSNPLGALIAWMASASATSLPVRKSFIAGQTQGIHPPVFVSNEGFLIENVLVGSSTTNLIQVVIEVAWAEVTGY